LKLIEIIKTIALNKKNKIAIGLGNNKEYLNRIKSAISYFDNLTQFEITLVHSTNLEIPFKVNNSKITIISSKNPSFKLLQLLKENKIDGIIRGTIGSSEFLKAIKDFFQFKKISRIALLESSNGKDFFFAPVGIDEGRTKDEKIFFIKEGYKILKKFNVMPCIAVLSGGRVSDIGRDDITDKTIKEAEEIVHIFKEQSYNIFHSEILIEKAVKNSNFILAPDGITGNLIYRTLVHLGNGLSHGAIYIEPFNINKIIIDTSRVGPINEYISAIMLASAAKGLFSQS